MRYALDIVGDEFGPLIHDDGKIGYCVPKFSVSEEVASAFWKKHGATILEDTKDPENMKSRYRKDFMSDIIRVKCYTDVSKTVIEFTKAKVKKTLSEQPAVEHSVTLVRTTISTAVVKINASSREEAYKLALEMSESQEYTEYSHEDKVSHTPKGWE